MSDTLANLIAKKYIARSDVKAIQHTDGSWSPHTKNGKRDGERIPWKRDHLNAHLECKQSFGHYLLNQDNQCKLFAFDIDLEKTGSYPVDWPEIQNPDVLGFQDFNPREAWLDRSHQARAWMKYQFKMIAHKLMRAIHEELEIPTAAAYSGGKGVHVYGFTGLLPADEVREGAQIVLDKVGEFKIHRGEHFFRHVNEDPFEGYPNLSIEVFPKQTNLDGKDLGNLMRLPLGRNLKSKDPTFFIDMTSPMGVMAPVDPEFALTTTDPWRIP